MAVEIGKLTCLERRLTDENKRLRALCRKMAEETDSLQALLTSFIFQATKALNPSVTANKEQ